MGNSVSQAGRLDTVQVYCYLKTLTTPCSLKSDYQEKLYAISSFISKLDILEVSRYIQASLRYLLSLR